MNKLTHLKNKHKMLDNEINMLYKQSTYNENIITDLKKQKLNLKDKINNEKS